MAKAYGVVVDRFDTGELMRMARRRLAEYSYTPRAGTHLPCQLSTPEMLYHLAKHIEGQDIIIQGLLRHKVADAQTIASLEAQLHRKGRS